MKDEEAITVRVPEAIRIDRELHSELVKMSKKEHRKICNTMYHILKEYFKTPQKSTKKGDDKNGN